MFGVPSACLTAEEFVEHGCNFFLIETNDLTQYTHAVDRDISIAERYYRPASHAMKKLIRMVVEAAREGGIPVTICGSAVAIRPTPCNICSWACGALGQPAKPH